MGNSSTVSVGHLFLQVQNPNVQAGGQVAGVVHVNLSIDIPAVSLGLKFRGKEYCHWYEPSEDSATNQVGKRVIFRQVFPVFYFQNGVLLAGQYSFPFAFYTPPTLHGSFFYRDDKTIGQVSYKLTAFLQTEAKVDRSSADIRVLASLPPITPITGTMTKEITQCCSNKGRVRVSVTVGKNAYAAGETVDIWVGIDNSQSRVTILGVVAALFQTIRLRSEYHHTFTEKYRVNDFRADRRILPGEVHEGERQIHCPFPVADNVGRLQIMSTVHGEIVECVYMLLVKVQTDGGGSPELEQEMVVYSAQLAPAQLPPIPVGWNPVMMPAVQLQ